MAIFDLNPAEGPHMAAGLSDQDLELLQHVLAVELAIRLDKNAYQQRFRQIASHRTEMDEIVSDWRNQRDRMVFEAAVNADLDQIPVLEDHQVD